VVLDRKILQQNDVKFNRDPEMSRDWKDIGALQTDPYTALSGIPPEAIKGVVSGDVAIREMVKHYDDLKHSIAVKAGREARSKPALPEVGETETHMGAQYKFDGKEWVKQ
jgi:hypothetical protein